MAGRRVAALGDTCALVSTSGPVEAQHLAAAVRAQAWAGVEEVVPAADSVGIVVEPEAADPLELGRRAALLPAPAPAADVRATRRHDVEVCFDGPDLEDVARTLALAPSDVVELLEGARLEVGWLGFMPGFAYLGGLPAPLAAIGRLERPRARVPAGSFALAGGMAGIYPFATPGGWRVLGRTATSFFEPELAPYAVLAPGDTVRVRAVAVAGEPPPPDRVRLSAPGPRRVTVLEPGVLTTVQDAGRIGVAHLGVPRGGPADTVRHRLANAAVGNPPGAPALEITHLGPTLLFDDAAFVALVGDAALALDGREMPAGAVVPVAPGTHVSVGRLRTGARAYLGVGGGLLGPRYFGSYATDTATPLPPGPLRAGDEIGTGTPGRARGRFGAPAVRTAIELPVLPGPEGDSTFVRGRLASRTWTVGPATDRIGIRLENRGPSVRSSDRILASRAAVTGAVQLPPNGEPIVLGPDHGTLGGYPVVAAVPAAAFALLGQALPGDTVTFHLLEEGERFSVATTLDGWFPLGS